MLPRQACAPPTREPSEVREHGRRDVRRPRSNAVLQPDLGERTSRRAATGSRSGAASGATGSPSRSIVFIIFLFLAAFAARRSPTHVLGHGPNDQFAGGLDPKTCMPVGPLDVRLARSRTRVRSDHYGDDALPPRRRRPARPRRVPAPALRRRRRRSRSPSVATVARHGRRRPHGRDGRLLPRLDRHDRLPPDRDRDGLPDPALHHRAGEHRRRPARQRSPSAASSARGWSRSSWCSASSAGSTRRASCAPQVLSLREKEFIEAARMVGASDWRIIRSHLLPHLVAPIIVLSTITVAQFILAEAGLSFLGIGIQLPDAELGQPAFGRAGLLPDPAVADGLARARRAARDARVQPPRRRAPRRVRPARQKLVTRALVSR